VKRAGEGDKNHQLFSSTQAAGTRRGEDKKGFTRGCMGKVRGRKKDWREVVRQFFSSKSEKIGRASRRGEKKLVWRKKLGGPNP